MNGRMKKVYLVDSENVGDVWVPLLASSQPDEEILVFYTLKSPHMSYENVRMLKETRKEVAFIKCFEGSNALDFQLVTELGYRLRENEECEYVIVSNDTGFDAAIRYWSTRKKPVSRLNGKECLRQATGKNQRTQFQTEEKTQTTVTPAGTAWKDTAVQPGQEEPTAEPAREAATGPVQENMALEPAWEAAEPTQESAVTEPAQEKPAEDPGREKSAAGAEQKETAAKPKRERAAKRQSVEKRQDASGQPTALKGEDPTASEIVKPTASETVKSAASKDEEPAASESDGQTVSEPAQKPENEASLQETHDDTEAIVKSLCHCISKDNLADFHNALVTFFGEDKGKEIYQEVKGNPEWTVYWAQLPENSQKEKFDIYCRMVFEHSELAQNYPEDFSAFLLKSNGKRKNLNSLRAALQGQYGKDKGMKYYSLFKSHIKIMNRM